MRDDDWEAFCSDVVKVVRSCSTALHFVGFGTGQYLGTEEESFTVTATPATETVEQLTDSLSRLCRDYAQECVAMVQGFVTLVS
jgi:hypothetical protein